MRRYSCFPVGWRRATKILRLACSIFNSSIESIVDSAGESSPVIIGHVVTRPSLQGDEENGTGRLKAHWSALNSTSDSSVKETHHRLASPRDSSRLIYAAKIFWKHVNGLSTKIALEAPESDPVVMGRQLCTLRRWVRDHQQAR